MVGSTQRRVARFVFVLAVLAGRGAWAADPPRPNEEEMFGAPPASGDAPAKSDAAGKSGTAAKGDTPAKGEAPAPARPKEDDLFGAPAPAADPAQQPGMPEASTATPRAAQPTPARVDRPDPLAIGGILYLRSAVYATEGAKTPGDWTLSLPSIVDGYLDARPNDRVRGLVLGRLFFDASSRSGSGSSLGAAGGTTGAGAASKPHVVLDQLWVKFDVEHTVFVTAGRQHVKWGTARFWTPTDFLHSVRLDPLAVFDERTGTTMLKLHLPWESKGWNFYGVAAFDLDEPASTLRRVAGAGRAEVVFGSVELGADVLARASAKPRVGVDASAGVGPFDVYVESALTTAERTRWRAEGGPCGLADVSHCARVKDDYFSPATTIGLNWSYKYSDEDSVTLGGEFFYNPSGYSAASLYPLAFSSDELVPFYAGRAYAGLYLLLPRPGSWNNTTINLATLGNLTDRSFISRLDWQVLVLTYLRVEVYGAVQYGTRGGEFRFSLDRPDMTFPGTNIPAVVRPPVFQAGLALKMAL